MEALVTISKSGQDVTSSLIVARIFNKKHRDVLRDISNLNCSKDFNERNFALIEYFDARKRKQKAFEITKDGFSFLVMGYTGDKAAEFKENFINEFNNRELLLKSDEYILLRSQEILSKKLKQLESSLKDKDQLLELKDLQLKLSSKKVAYHDQILQSEGLLSITEIAKELGYVSGKALNKDLKDLGVQYKVNNCWVLTAAYSSNGYTKTKTFSVIDQNGLSKSVHNLYWTELGRKFLHNFTHKKFIIQK